VPTDGWVAAGRGVEVPPDMLEEPDLIARAAVYLATQDATGITGTVQYSSDLLAAVATADER
jgi:hypothetical protein